jgi:hypothetical protein
MFLPISTTLGGPPRDNLKLTSFVVCAIAVLLGLVAAPSNSATYTKQADLAPLRVTYADLQDILDKAASLMQKANDVTEFRHESVRLDGKDHRVAISGHRFLTGEIKLPNRCESFFYDADPTPPAFGPSDIERIRKSLPLLPLPPNYPAITQVSLYFTNHSRSLTVSGESPEQVDALFAAIRDDLDGLSSNFGGEVFTLVSTYAILILTLIAGYRANGWWRSRNRHDWRVAFSACTAAFAVVFVISSGLFAGFSAVHGDASFMVRYGPQFGFWSFMIAAISPWVSMWRTKEPQKT